MNKENIKRRYMDFRFGNQTLSPIIQFSNFMMLGYLTINEVIPIWLFAPLFVIAILFTYTFVGNKFRHHQQPTDLNMGFEKATKAAMSVYMMMKRIEEIAAHTNTPKNTEFANWMKYIKEISEGKK